MATVTFDRAVIASDDEPGFSCQIERLADGTAQLTCASSANINTGELGSLSGTPVPLDPAAPWKAVLSSVAAEGASRIAATPPVIGGPHAPGFKEDVVDDASTVLGDDTSAEFLESHDDGVVLTPGRVLIRAADTAMAVVPLDVAAAVESALGGIGV